MKLSRHNAVSMAPGFPASAGLSAIEADLSGFLKEHKAHHSTDIHEIAIDGNIAVERSSYTHEFTPTGGETTTEIGKHVIVYRRSTRERGRFSGKSGHLRMGPASTSPPDSARR